MKKIYNQPRTKVMNLNCQTIMEKSLTPASYEPGGDETTAPALPMDLFYFKRLEKNDLNLEINQN